MQLTARVCVCVRIWILLLYSLNISLSLSSLILWLQYLVRFFFYVVYAITNNFPDSKATQIILRWFLVSACVFYVCFLGVFFLSLVILAFVHSFISCLLFYMWIIIFVLFLWLFTELYYIWLRVEGAVVFVAAVQRSEISGGFLLSLFRVA